MLWKEFVYKIWVVLLLVMFVWIWIWIAGFQNQRTLFDVPYILLKCYYSFYLVIFLSSSENKEMIKTEKLVCIKKNSRSRTNVVREHYLRKDIPCKSALCSSCDIVPGMLILLVGCGGESWEIFALLDVSFPFYNQWSNFCFLWKIQLICFHF